MVLRYVGVATGTDIQKKVMDITWLEKNLRALGEG
ncbi:hypothetical protein B738_22880 [Photorhabdus temperata subsp. temperata M1021]|nr:hypothetical protein B738_22880 [Photorhabdus temperata subsp. temperata M1021]